MLESTLFLQGAAPLLENKDTLETAAGILAVEAYHGGAIRALLLEQAEQVCLHSRQVNCSWTNTNLSYRGFVASYLYKVMSSSLSYLCPADCVPLWGTGEGYCQSHC